MMMTTRKARFSRHVLALTLVFGGLMGAEQSAHALESSFNAINFTPATDNTNYYTVWGSKTLDPLQFNTNLIFDYGRKPLECDGCPQNDVISHLIVGNLGFGIGITERFEIGINLPVVMYNQFYNETTGVEQTDGGIGDVSFSTKIRLVDIDAHRVGFSLLPFLTAPTGDSEKFLGNGSVTGGASFIVDFKPADVFEIALNAGYRFRDDVTRTSTRIDDQILYGVGLVGHVTDHVDVLGEIQGSTVARDAWGSVPQSPLEAEVGVRYRMDNGFAFNVGGGPGIIDGVGSPTFRAIAGISFTSPKRDADEAPRSTPAPKRARLDEDQKKIVITDRIYFDFDKDTLKTESFPVLDDVASVMKNDDRIKLVMVEGHTDSVGSDAYNDSLSTRRARAAMNYLIKAGVDSSRLEFSGKGETQPIASNANDDGRAQNRRTEFLVVQLGSR